MKYLLLVAVLFCVGCFGVKPETMAKIDLLTKQVETLDVMIQDIQKRHSAGEITTAQAASELKPLIAQVGVLRTELTSTMAKAKEEGSSQAGTVGLILLNVLIVIAGRLLGVPGLASSSGGNLLNLGRSLLSRSSTETAKP